MEIASSEMNEMTMLVSVAGQAILEVGTVAPLADGADCGCGECAVAGDDSHGAHGAIRVHPGCQGDYATSADIWIDRIDETQRRSRSLDTAVLAGEWEVRSRGRR